MKTMKTILFVVIYFIIYTTANAHWYPVDTIDLACQGQIEISKWFGEKNVKDTVENLQYSNDNTLYKLTPLNMPKGTTLQTTVMKKTGGASFEYNTELPEMYFSNGKPMKFIEKVVTSLFHTEPVIIIRNDDELVKKKIYMKLCIQQTSDNGRKNCYDEIIVNFALLVTDGIPINMPEYHSTLLYRYKKGEYLPVLND